MASSEVGTCTKRTPRKRLAATKPARSPTTPPPSATTKPRRSTLASMAALYIRATCPRRLEGSPAGMRASATWNPASVKLRVARSV